MATTGMPLGFQTGFQAVDEERQTEATTTRTQQLTKLAAAQTDEAENKVWQQKQLQAFMMTPLPPPPGDAAPTSAESIISQVQARSQQLLAAGFSKEGADLGEKASQMQAHAATIRNQSFQQRTKALDEQSKAMDQMAGLLAPVHDQTSLNAVVLSWRALHPDDPIPDQFLTYDPEKFDLLREGTTKGQAFLKQKRDDLRQENLQADREDRARDRVFREDQEKQRTRILQEREDRIIKNDGPKSPKVGEPTKEGMALATSVVRQGFPGLAPDVFMGKDATTQGAVAVASDAKVRMAQNPGLSLSEATNQAFIAAKDRGDFKHIDATRGGYRIIGGSAAKDIYSPHSGGKAPPGVQIHPAPSSAKEVVQGQYYQKNGKTYLATPQGMQEIQ